jgi:hypothetical protein
MLIQIDTLLIPDKMRLKFLKNCKLIKANLLLLFLLHCTSSFAVTKESVLNLNSFEAIPTQEGVTLEWVSINEIKNSSFLIERSVDGKVFEEISRVKVENNSTNIKSHSYVDQKPKTNLTYYRLKQVNRNGKSVLSSVIAVKYKNPILSKIPSLSFNGKNLLQISFLGKQNQESEIYIYSYAGIEVFKKRIAGQDGLMILDIKTPPLNRGIYIVALFNGKETLCNKLFIN